MEDTLTIISKKGGRFARIIPKQVLGHRTSNLIKCPNGKERNSERSKTDRKRNDRVKFTSNLPRINRAIKSRRTTGNPKSKSKTKAKRKIARGHPEDKHKKTRTMSGQTQRKLVLKRAIKDRRMHGATSAGSSKTQRTKTKTRRQKVLGAMLEAGMIMITMRMKGIRKVGAQRRNRHGAMITRKTAHKVVHGDTATIIRATRANATAVETDPRSEAHETRPEAVVIVAQSERHRGIIMTMSSTTIPGKMATINEKIPQTGTGVTMGHRSGHQGLPGPALAGTKTTMVTQVDGEKKPKRATGGQMKIGMAQQRSVHGAKKGMCTTRRKEETTNVMTEAIARVHHPKIRGGSLMTGAEMRHRILNFEVIPRPRKTCSGDVKIGFCWAERRVCCISY